MIIMERIHHGEKGLEHGEYKDKQITGVQRVLFCWIIDYTPAVPVVYDPLCSVISPSLTLSPSPSAIHLFLSPPLPLRFSSRPSFLLLSFSPSFPSFILPRSLLRLSAVGPQPSHPDHAHPWSLLRPSSSSSAPLQLTPRRVDHDPEYTSFSAPSISPTVLNFRAGTLNPTPTATLVCRQSRLEAIPL